MKRLIHIVIGAMLLSGACNSSQTKERTHLPQIVTNNLEVIAPPDSLELNSFYKKYILAEGIPVIASHKVPDTAIFQAWTIVSYMMKSLPEEVRVQMVNTGVKVGIMARYEGTTDIPEHAHLASDTTLNWDVRARGLGGSPELPLTTCAEENLLCYQIDKYHAEDILIHEFAHTIHIVGIEPITPGFNAKLQQMLDNAILDGKYVNTYAKTNLWEYWAEGVQTWFNANGEVEKPDGKHNEINTREELKTYDKELSDLLKAYFGEPEENPSCHRSQNIFMVNN